MSSMFSSQGSIDSRTYIIDFQDHHHHHPSENVEGSHQTESMNQILNLLPNFENEIGYMCPDLKQSSTKPEEELIEEPDLSSSDDDDEDVGETDETQKFVEEDFEEDSEAVGEVEKDDGGLAVQEVEVQIYHDEDLEGATRHARGCLSYGTKNGKIIDDNHFTLNSHQDFQISSHHRYSYTRSGQRFYKPAHNIQTLENRFKFGYNQSLIQAWIHDQCPQLIENQFIKHSIEPLKRLVELQLHLSPSPRPRRRLRSQTRHRLYGSSSLGPQTPLRFSPFQSRTAIYSYVPNPRSIHESKPTIAEIEKDPRDLSELLTFALDQTSDSIIP